MTIDFIFPYIHKVTINFEKRKQAASVLNQMVLVLRTMNEDLDHRQNTMHCMGKLKG